MAYYADPEILKETLKNYDFEFENLCFEGGGVKGLGHVGMVQVRLMPCSIYVLELGQKTFFVGLTLF